MLSRKLIVIAGPTAVGKTNVAIQLAKFLNCPIISADSRQVFKELPIGSAAPSLSEQQGVKHYFIADRSIHHSFSAGEFSQEASQTIKAELASFDNLIVCGGSGLYIKALIEGFDEMPYIDESLRQQIIQSYQSNGLNWLQAEVNKLDPDYFKIVDQQNPQRLLRALEVCQSTGKPFSCFRKNQKSEQAVFDDFYVNLFVLDLPRALLYDRINRRVEHMIRSGLVGEAKTVYPFKHLNALQTVGYKELFDYFDGKVNLEQAIELIKQNTRRFAKRQLTWFRRQNAIWLNAENQEKVIQEIIKISDLTQSGRID